MTPKRVLIISNTPVADPASVPEVVAKQVREADKVYVVAPALTGRLHSWLSDIDAELHEADERMQKLVSGIGLPTISGQVGDEDPLQAVADALVTFPADALIIGVHPAKDANWRERHFGRDVRERFGLPVTELILDREGRVLSVSAE
jgi:hypothetical protein